MGEDLDHISQENKTPLISPLMRPNDIILLLSWTLPLTARMLFMVNLIK